MKRWRGAGVLAALSAAVSAIALSACGSDGSASTDGGAEAGGGLLYVQSAEEASFSGAGEAMKLTLRGASSVTTAFTDAPRRDAFTLSTVAFSQSFGDRFASGAPNATVSSIEAGVGEFVVELSGPRLPSDRTVVYSVRPIKPRTGLPERTGPVSVFIDADTVTPPLPISGKVLLPDGTGLAGATIETSFEAKECGWSSCSTHREGIAIATTESSGSFAVEEFFPLGEPYTLRASKPGYSADEVTETVQENGTFYEFELTEAP